MVCIDLKSETISKMHNLNHFAIYERYVNHRHQISKSFKCSINLGEKITVLSFSDVLQQL